MSNKMSICAHDIHMKDADQCKRKRSLLAKSGLRKKLWYSFYCLLINIAYRILPH